MTKNTETIILTSPSTASAIINLDHGNPANVLGIQTINFNQKESKVIRVHRPDAQQIQILDKQSDAVITLNAPDPIAYPGYFEAIIPKSSKLKLYSLRIINHFGQEIIAEDPYAYYPYVHQQIIGEQDLYLFHEGRHEYIYKKLGAHPVNIKGTDGYHFAVWAPNAQRISVIGEFNYWDGKYHPMQKINDSGVWELFIPGVTKGTLYKFEIKTKDCIILKKADPYANQSEVPIDAASITTDVSAYKWQDKQWLKQRQDSNLLNSAVSIYEVHLGSWRKSINNEYLSYRELAHQLVDYVKQTGFTHIELMPIMEHPFDGSWGYQVTGYYAPTQRFGTPEDFMYFVDYCHQNNIGVILGWVPGHFPADHHGLVQFDGTALYEHQDPRQGWHPDWQTCIPNFGRHEVRNFFVANALFWLDNYHIDGFRVDAVASLIYLDYARKNGEWIPNAYGGKENIHAISFLQECNAVIYQHYPGTLMIAEESTSWTGVSHPTFNGGLGFSHKWDMGWMHDTLSYMSKDPLYRKYHQNDLTFRGLYMNSENFVLPLSHDEVVHGKGSIMSKMPGDIWQKFANARLLYGWMYAQPGKKHLFQGCEFGQWSEWNSDYSLDWHLLEADYGYGRQHQTLLSYISDLNHLLRNEPAMHQGDHEPWGYALNDATDHDHSVISLFRRFGEQNNTLLCVFNFTPELYTGYRIGVPKAHGFREIFNSDCEGYGGTNKGNAGWVSNEQIPYNNYEQSISITVPPLGMVVFRLSPY